jgi:hypothetical protein
MLEKARRFAQLWQAMGPGWLAFRLGYTVRLRTGIMRRQLPPKNWADLPFNDLTVDPDLAEPEAYWEYRRQSAPPFFFAPADREHFSSILTHWDSKGTTPVATAEEIARGEFTYFSHSKKRPGSPPDWHSNPFTGQRAPADRHWSEIDEFDYGDIKVIWELNRFGFVFPLVRAYWRTGEERYAELFWQLVEDWRTQNPPQRGPNWKCGQETAFRVMAWCFGLYGFLDSQASTAQRVATLARMVAISAQRIEGNLSYALSQRNNHGISEGMGLWTVGLLFPEFRRAARWREIGAKVLEEQAQELIYADGSFVQNSVNYHRLMLHDFLWSVRLGDLHNRPFSGKLGNLIGRAGDWLYQIQDEFTGQVPCYGSNDGALVLPLNNCNYQDYRPVVQATQFLHNGTLCYDRGPWDEDLLWLFGPAALEARRAAQRREDWQADVGGYYTLRTPASMVFTRCPTYQHRPGHADALHVDLWWKGQNIALDAGTYSYNEPAPWNSPLVYTAYHNTVTVDGLDQMERVGKFLWLPWLHGQVRPLRTSTRGHLTYWEGAHDGYQRLAQPTSHRRGVLRLDEEWWLIVDGLASPAEHEYRLHWLLADVPYEWTEDTGHLALQTPAGPYHTQSRSMPEACGRSLMRAAPTGPRGWRAPYYRHREPALSIELATQATSALLGTVFGPEPCTLTIDSHELQVMAPLWKAAIRWEMDASRPLITEVTLEGRYRDRLEFE